MIFFVIAGVYTPYGLLSLDSHRAKLLVGLFWVAATLGGFFKVVWVSAPRTLSVALYIAMSWSGMLIYEDLIAAIGAAPVAAMLYTGIAITVGAVSYMFAWPGREAKHFGYHEIFHLTVIAHLAVHFWVIADLVLKVI
jgi:hemolysin III